MASAEDKGKGPVDEGTFDPETPEVAAPNPPPPPPPPPPKEEPAGPAADKELKLDIDPPKGTGPLAVAPHAGGDYVDPDPVPFIDITELQRWSFWRAAIAEFLATFLFLYITVQTIIGTNATAGGVGTLGVAFAFGITIFVLVYCIGGISGGHINPAITLAMLLVRRVSLPRALVYWIAQILGALCGVGLVKAYQKGFYQRYGGGANFVHYGYPKGAALVAELVGTFLLVYVVFTATDAKRQVRDAHVPPLAPLAIGLAVFVVHLATIPITGTGINPARSFAPAVYWDHHDHAWDDHWIFWVGPFLGAALAACYQMYVIRAIPFHNLQLANFRYRV